MMEYYTKSGNLSKSGKEHNQYIAEGINTFRTAIEAVDKCAMIAADHAMIKEKLNEYISKLENRKLPARKVDPGPKLSGVLSVPIVRNVMTLDRHGHVVETERIMRQIAENVYIGTEGYRMSADNTESLEIFVLYQEYNICFSVGFFSEDSHVLQVKELCDSIEVSKPEDLIRRISNASEKHCITSELYLEIARRIDLSVYEKCVAENERQRENAGK